MEQGIKTNCAAAGVLTRQGWRYAPGTGEDAVASLGHFQKALGV
jgi:hypothetical protein